MSENDLYILVYSSLLKDNYLEQANGILNEITSTAKTNNPSLNITGVLFYHHGTFIQIIEGPKQNLEQLFQKIENDERHKQVEIIIKEPENTRGYDNWNMDSFNLSLSNELNTDQIKSASEIYRQNLVLKSNILADFYKQTLSTY